MNHIEFYENIIKDYSLSTDLRVYTKNFYQMELEEAHKVIDTIKTLLDMKTNDFMRS